MVEIVLAKLVVQGFICSISEQPNGFWRFEVSEVGSQASAQVTCPSLFLLSGPFRVQLLSVLKVLCPCYRLLAFISMGTEEGCGRAAIQWFCNPLRAAYVEAGVGME